MRFPSRFLAVVLGLMIAAFVVIIPSGCGSAQSDGAEAKVAGDASTSDAGLSQDQLEKGIGPIQNVTLTEQIDLALAEKGEEIYGMKCTACHKMDTRYVGPPLRDVVMRRTPEYVMNMMLNTQEMIERHPVVKELLGQYMTPMPNQSLTEEDARAILEHLRHEHEEGLSLQQSKQ